MPSDHIPITLGSENIDRSLSLECPLMSNPQSVCNWSKYDDNNARQEVLRGNNIRFSDQSNCSIDFFPLKEIHSGLYECTAVNAIGSTTYTFPERFTIESKG